MIASFRYRIVGQSRFALLFRCLPRTSGISVDSKAFTQAFRNWHSLFFLPINAHHTAISFCQQGFILISKEAKGNGKRCISPVANPHRYAHQIIQACRKTVLTMILGTDRKAFNLPKRHRIRQTYGPIHFCFGNLEETNIRAVIDDLCCIAINPTDTLGNGERLPHVQISPEFC